MSRSIVTRYLMPIVQLVLLVQMAVFAGVFQHKYGALVMFFAYIFFSVWVQQHTFGLLLTCAPRSLSQYVCGFPALSRTFGSSLAGSLNQSIFAIVGAIIPNDDSKKLHRQRDFCGGFSDGPGGFDCSNILHALRKSRG
uniref:Transmembrane domain-containing protein n=1 Tax=Spironucleus salmonicida TaxID=348837 RepID=V6LXY4_9EUKA|eukprot:EST49420.1 Transmembrane domain-containing protein [Spironucleus salmonicida]